MKPKSENAFDCLRLLAAMTVLFSHSFALTGHGLGELVYILSGGRMELGEIAVLVFFTMSGCLVSASWLGDPHVGRFMQRRCLRILPALVFVIVASFLVGAALTTLTVADYFSRPDAWSFLTKIFIYPTQYGLPEVFHNNPVPDVVDGSLWTLRLEFALYLAVAALGRLGWLRPKISWVVVVVCLMVGLCMLRLPIFQNLAFAHQLMVLLVNTIAFFIGASFAGGIFDATKTIRVVAVVGLVAMPLVFVGAIKFYVAMVLSLVVLVVAKTISCNLSKMGDYSYGVYLWAFPVQQAVVSMHTGITPMKLFVVAGFFTLLLAMLSWRLVEKPALRLKPRRPAKD